MAEHAISSEREPALILGYARVSEPALRAAAHALATALTGPGPRGRVPDP